MINRQALCRSLLSAWWPAKVVQIMRFRAIRIQCVYIYTEDDDQENETSSSRGCIYDPNRYNLSITFLRRCFFCSKVTRRAAIASSSARYEAAICVPPSPPSPRPDMRHFCTSCAIAFRKSWSMILGMLSIILYRKFIESALNIMP